MTERILYLNREKTIFWGLLGILLLFVGFYMYCVRVTISNVVARQNLESESSGLTLSIGSQEFKYITKRNSVTLSLAHNLGFRDTEVKSFIARNPSAKVAFLSH